MPRIKSDKDKCGEASILQPNQEVINVKGKLFYHESAQSHSVIKLTKEVLYNYPQLKEKMSSFSYNMFLPRSNKEVEELMKSFEKEINAVPILLFFERNNKDK